MNKMRKGFWALGMYFGIIGYVLSVNSDNIIGQCFSIFLLMMMLQFTSIRLANDDYE
jgi:hypothetical protein